MNPDKEISGAVLIGGQSSRMGSPKALLPVDGIPMFWKVADQLSHHVTTVYLSHRTGVFELPENPYPIIPDHYDTISPMTGIVSVLEALQQAIFILPTDMPQIQDRWIKQLLQLRNPDEICTVYYHEQSGYYEPLIGIWEVLAIPALRECLDSGSLSFQKLLSSRNVSRHYFTDTVTLYNINTPDEFETWKKTDVK